MIARSELRTEEPGADMQGKGGAGGSVGADGSVDPQPAGSPDVPPGGDDAPKGGEGQGAGDDVPGDDPPGDDPPGDDGTIDSIAERHAGFLEDFDPTRHAVDKNGSPILTRAGAFAKKRGRKSTADSAPAPSASAVGNVPQTTNAPSIDGAKVGTPALQAAKLNAAAAMSTNLLFNIAVNFFGPEWEPQKDEPKMINTAFRDYYEANGYVDLPPGAALVLAIGIYALPRFKHENTRGKLSRIWGGVKHALANLRGH